MINIWRIEGTNPAFNMKAICCSKEDLMKTFSKYTFVGDDELLVWKVEGYITEFITVRQLPSTISLEELNNLV